MNYSDPTGDKIGIALTKVPSKYPADDPRWRGPILYNPVRIKLRTSSTLMQPDSGICGI